MRDSRHEQRSKVSKMHSVIHSGVFEDRGIASVQVTDQQKVDAPKVKTKEFNKLCNPNSHAAQPRSLDLAQRFDCSWWGCPFAWKRIAWLPAQVLKSQFQSLMKRKSKDHSWPATTHSMDFAQITATEWFFHCMKTGGANLSSAWQSVLVGAPGDVVASQSQGRCLLVLAVGPFAFLGWDLQVVGTNDDGLSMFSIARQFSLQFHFVTDLQDWISVPTQPKLGGARGPLLLEQTGAARGLIYARIAQGLALTVKQCHMLLSHLEVPFKKPGSHKSWFPVFVFKPHQQMLFLAGLLSKNSGRTCQGMSS